MYRIELNQRELDYLRYLVGNTSFVEFEERMSRFVPKEQMDDFRNGNGQWSVAHVVYDKLDMDQ